MTCRRPQGGGEGEMGVNGASKRKGERATDVQAQEEVMLIE